PSRVTRETDVAAWRARFASFELQRSPSRVTRETPVQGGGAPLAEPLQRSPSRVTRETLSARLGACADWITSTEPESCDSGDVDIVTYCGVVRDTSTEPESC